MTPNELSQFRSRLPHCELAVYADIRSRLVLATDGALRYPQEYLDALCACAAQLFEGIPDYAGQAVEQVLFLGPTGGRAFFRAESQPDEALCCIFGPGAGVAELTAQAGAALSAGGAA